MCEVDYVVAVFVGGGGGGGGGGWWGNKIEFRPSIKIAEASSQTYQATFALSILINETNRFFCLFLVCYQSQFHLYSVILV